MFGTICVDLVTTDLATCMKGKTEMFATNCADLVTKVTTGSKEVSRSMGDPLLEKKGRRMHCFEHDNVL